MQCLYHSTSPHPRHLRYYPNLLKERLHSLSETEASLSETERRQRLKETEKAAPPLRAPPLRARAALRALRATFLVESQAQRAKQVHRSRHGIRVPYTYHVGLGRLSGWDTYKRQDRSKLAYSFLTNQRTLVEGKSAAIV